MLTLNDGRSELWQWDTGSKLTVDADCSQVHFSNKVFGRSIDVDVVDGVAIIPDILLQTDKDLFAWAFVGTPENGYTKISKVFKINRRNKPADYVFTPPEQTTLGEILERLDKIEESQDPDAIKNAVDDYLANNPIQIKEADPTVPDWAKQPTKPTYTAKEVGAVTAVNGVSPDDNGNVEITIPDSGGNADLTGYAKEAWVQKGFQPKGNYLTEVPEGYAKNEDIPKVPSWAMQANKPAYTASEVGADPTGTAATAVSGHNTNNEAHNDIRLLIEGLTTRLNALANSTDTDLDQMAELVAYIKSNKSLIDGITTSKVSVADIVNNLTTNVANKPLSAAQGVAIKALIDNLSASLANYQPKGDYALASAVPTKVSQLANDKGYLTEHQDISGKADTTYVDEQIAEVKADAIQQTPLFANSIEECIDTSKLYVLPDGYIYGYIYTEVAGASYTNQLPLATDADLKTIYNGVGYKPDTRINNAGSETAATDLWWLTGYIPVKPGDVVRVKNWLGVSGSEHLALNLYANATNRTATYKQNELIALSTWDGHIDKRTPALLTFTIPSDANCSYMRMLNSMEVDPTSCIITVNEEIVENTGTTKEYAWANTGHAFVPADYEDRIIDAEGAIEEHETRLANLENRSVDGIPDYVVAEAEEVIDKVIAAQGSRTFTFAAITDMHYGNASYTDGLIHACQAMRYIDSRIKLDAVSVLGDYTDGFTGTGYDNAIGDFKAINAELNGLRFAPNLRVHGNHDHYEPYSPILHRYITAYSDDVVWGSKLGGYFYRDFEDFKIRIVCLNTAEENDDGLSCSAEQYKWFAGAIDLSSKADMAAWQTLILSHHPLDWFHSNNSGYVFWQILNAYLNGTSWNGFNYAGKNSAKIVGNIHGHIHNLLTRNIAAGQPSTTESTINVVRIATPEACYDRPNSYNDAWDYNPFGEETSYPKTKGTAEDTAFCIYCIDLDAHTIKAICYGAGYDREISY